MSKIKDKEIRELEYLLNFDALTNFTEETNPNYKFIYKAFHEQKFSKLGSLIGGFAGVALEGSSRSGKTWSSVDFIIYICTHVDKNATINIYRETYNEFKTTLYDDFKRRLDDYGLDNPFRKKEEIKSFKIGDNSISFLGDGKEGGGCDYAFFNEVMHIPQRVFDSVEMRCRKFWWADYNPSFSEHWFFDKVLQRPDVGFIRTTFKQNPYISVGERNKILGYEPWLPGSYEIDGSDIIYKGEIVDDKNQPPPHPINLENGTADEFLWRVYGLGLRGSMKGVVIKQLSWVDEFPDHVDHIYANDFGFTHDPNALVKYAEDEKNIWFELLYYDPVDTDVELDMIFTALSLDREKTITCDSSDKYTGENKGTVEMVKGLKRRGWKAKKVKKSKSVVYWLGSMREKKLHCVKNKLWKHVKKERENYKWKEVNGIFINQPEDKFNHIWDAVRYGHISYNTKTLVSKTTQSLSDMGIAY